MGVIYKLAVRNMKRRKARYIMTTITLVIGVALFGGIMIASDSFDKMFIDDIDSRMGTADILIRESETRDGWFREGDLEEIEGIEGITSISYRIAGFSVYSSLAPDGNLFDNSTRTAVYGIDPDSKDEEALGSDPFILDQDEDGDTIEELLEGGGRDIVITESLKIKLSRDLDAGDEIWVLPVDYHLILGKSQDYVSANINLWPKYRIVAIIRDLGEARDFDPETPDSFDTPSNGPCMFTSIDTAHGLVDGEISRKGQYNLAAIGVDDINNNERVMDDIEDELGDEFWSYADLKSDSVEDINESTEIMFTMFMMFALIALILSIILILNIFNIIKEEQEYETGMLQAIGASKTETFKMFLMQGAMMGLVGAILGTIGSFFMSYVIFWVTIESLKNIGGEFGDSFAREGFEIVLLPETVTVTFLIGLISCIMASIYPSWKASRKPLIECLNPLAQKEKRMKKHFQRRLMYGALGALLVITGTYLLMGRTGVGPERNASDATISMVSPTLILLGLIGILALFIGTLTKGFIKLFGFYLKQTKLLTKKNVLRHRKRTVLTFSMIALTMSYLVAISVMMGSFKAGIKTTVNDVMGCDIRIFAQNTPRSLEADLARVDGVEDVMGATHLNVELWDEGDQEWIGHGLLDKEWDKEVSVHVLDPGEVEDHMLNTKIFKPEDMTLEEMMDDVSDMNTMIITDKEADGLGLDVDDEVMVKFSLGISYPTLDDFITGEDKSAIEDTTIVMVTVVAIVEKFQGFATGNIIGQEENAYNIYVSWETYEAAARNSLPGGNTDIIFRQKTQSGNAELDIVQPNWFNFSQVYSTLEGLSDIAYYTTRMEYLSPTYSSDLIFSNPGDFAVYTSKVLMNSSVVGIRTNNSGDFKWDSSFGDHRFVEKSSAYQNNKTMEELLNSTKKVCVIDQTFYNNMKAMDPSFGIDKNITIFPQQFDLTLITTGGGFMGGIGGTLPVETTMLQKNGTYLNNVAEFEISDNTNMTFISDETVLEFNISINMAWYFGSVQELLNPYDLTIESAVNSSVDLINLEVFNYFTSSFEKLGDISSQTETNHTFKFNQYYPAFSYIDLETQELKLRVVGRNSTFSNNYGLDIDCLKFRVNSSTYTLNPETWTNYTVIGIIEDPVLYSTERLNWIAGSESLYDVAQTENSVYINYENARSEIYYHNQGTAKNGSDDKITHVYIHCNDVDSIKRTRAALIASLGSNYTVLDLKTNTLDFRTTAFDWYIWIEEGEDDEEVLEDLIEYLEDRGYIVMFAFTNSYITTIFESMIDLITGIFSGILVFAIIIAMIGLALHCLLSTMSRRREIGMLRSIGLSKKGVVRTISGETLCVALLGAIVGIFAGLLTGSIMVLAMPSTGFLTVTLTYPWPTIAILVAVTFLTAIASARFPSRWAANINIIDAVRTR